MAHLHADEQLGGQELIHHLLDRLMIDDDLRRPVLMRHPKVIFGFQGACDCTTNAVDRIALRAKNPCRIKTFLHFILPFGSRRSVPLALPVLHQTFHVNTLEEPVAYFYDQPRLNSIRMFRKLVAVQPAG